MPNQINIGDFVLAIGNPFGVGQTVTQGIVSAVGRDSLNLNTFENFIQTDAAINPGNSGGALVNGAGELIGINTAIYSQTGSNIGIGFAIPIETVTFVLTKILNEGKVSRGFVGIQPADISNEYSENVGRIWYLCSVRFKKFPSLQGGSTSGRYNLINSRLTNKKFKTFFKNSGRFRTFLADETKIKTR